MLFLAALLGRLGRRTRRLPLISGYRRNRYDQIGQPFIDDGATCRYQDAAIIIGQMSCREDGERLVALQIVPIRAANAVVAAHALLIGNVVRMQPVKKFEPEFPLLEVRRHDVQQQKGLPKRISLGEYLKFFLDSDHFVQWRSKGEPAVELENHVGGCDVANRQAHFIPLLVLYPGKYTPLMIQLNALSCFLQRLPLEIGQSRGENRCCRSVE